MIQVYGKRPIAAQRQYVNQVKRLKDGQDNPLPVFDAWIRENKSMFGVSGYGVPVVLTDPNPGTHRNVVKELEKFASEFQRRLEV